MPARDGLRVFGKDGVVGLPSRPCSASGLAFSATLSHFSCYCPGASNFFDSLYALGFPGLAASAASLSATPNAFMECSSALLLSS